jgi:hypothetical protein
MTSETYRPSSAGRPRGGRPWCGNCHTDKHLVAGSVTVLDPGEQTLAVAVTCTHCGDSRVLETTKALAAALGTGPGTRNEGPEAYPGPVHCMEPMSLVAPVTGDFRPLPEDQPAGDPPPRVLRCRCGFQMDAPGTTPDPSFPDQTMRTP